MVLVVLAFLSYIMCPVYSCSFGLPCVFMIGGRTKAREPQSVYLRDGDVFIMSGDSRLSYHAVPRILPPHYFTQSRVNRLQTASTSELKRRAVTVNADEAKRRKSSPENTSDCFLDMELLSRVESSAFWDLFEDYVSKNRINLNVRQMFDLGRTADSYVWPDKDTWKPPISDGLSSHTS